MIIWNVPPVGAVITHVRSTLALILLDAAPFASVRLFNVAIEAWFARGARRRASVSSVCAFGTLFTYVLTLARTRLGITALGTFFTRI